MIICIIELFLKWFIGKVYMDIVGIKLLDFFLFIIDWVVVGGWINVKLLYFWVLGKW